MGCCETSRDKIAKEYEDGSEQPENDSPRARNEVQMLVDRTLVDTSMTLEQKTMLAKGDVNDPDELDQWKFEGDSEEEIEPFESRRVKWDTVAKFVSVTLLFWLNVQTKRSIIAKVDEMLTKYSPEAEGM